MKVLLSSLSVALLGLSVAPAIPADLPIKAPRPQVAAYSWTGFYAGGGFGYGMFNLESSLSEGGAQRSDNQTLGGKGFFGTVVAGFDYQLSPRFVVGAFTDYDFSNIKGDWSDPYWEEAGRIKQRSAWSVGARGGYLIAPTVLSYFTVGYSRASFSEAVLFGMGLPNQPTPDRVSAHSYSGWFLGGGTEALLTAFPGWSVRTEYRLAEYGRDDVQILLPAGRSPTFTHLQPRVQTVRTDLVYRFGGGNTVYPAAISSFAPAFNWAGFYAGAGGGYGMFNLRSSETENSVLQSDNLTYGGRGWFGTVIGGYDYQFAPRFLAGVFADYDFSNIKGHWGDTNREASGPIKQRNAWSVGGRAGYLLFPDLLTFVSGGYTQARFSSADLFAFGLANQPVGETLASQTYSGWFIGSGVEAPIAALPGLTLRSEYRFADYGAKDVPIFGVTNAFAHIHPYVQTVRTELVYRFAGPIAR